MAIVAVARSGACKIMPPTIAKQVAALIGPERKTLTVSEASRILSVSTQHICDLIEEGALRAINVAGSANATPRAFWRITIPEFIAFSESRSNQGEPTESTKGRIEPTAGPTRPGDRRG